MKAEGAPGKSLLSEFLGLARPMDWSDRARIGQNT